MRQLRWALVVWAAGLCSLAAENAEKLFCKLAERDFTRSEIVKIAGKDLDDKGLKGAAAARYPELAAIVLCSRSGIELSFEHTRRALLESLQLLSDSQRRHLAASLKQQNLTEEQWINQEAGKFDRQLNEALQRWFKLTAGDNVITNEQIRSYYYRHMNQFRRTQLNAELMWVFAAGDHAALQRALAALRQGRSAAEVRKNFSLAIEPAEVMSDLMQGYPHRRKVQQNYWVIEGARQLYLLEGGAFRQLYLPLDEKLARAIARTLYDALAKAFLQQKIHQDFTGKPIRFY